MKNLNLYFFVLILFGLSLNSCVEPYSLLSKTYEDLLVVESTLTDVLKHQKVVLSITSKLDTFRTNNLANAQVWISDNDNNKFTFSEDKTGTYLSDQEFKAMPNIEYKLFIETSEGNNYESRAEILTPKVLLSNIYAELTTKNGEQGVQVYIDSDEVNDDAKFFRYEYEETYKIITPWEITSKLVLENVFTSPHLKFDLVAYPLEEQIQVCYTTNKQTRIIQTNTSDLSENIIKKRPIRFIEGDDLMLKHRYSILVKQYTQTYDSYSYYQTLAKLGNFENLFEENQPGFVYGNLYSNENPNERVIGFFNVSSLDSKRIYFNFGDFGLPPPSTPCNVKVLNYTNTKDRRELYNYFKDPDTSTWNYYKDPVSGPFPPLYKIISPSCGNCTLKSSNIKPVFWED